MRRQLKAALMEGNDLGRGTEGSTCFEAQISEHCWSLKYNAGCSGRQGHESYVKV